jgi:hypothetical protein
MIRHKSQTCLDIEIEQRPTDPRVMGTSTAKPLWTKLCYELFGLASLLFKLQWPGWPCQAVLASSHYRAVLLASSVECQGVSMFSNVSIFSKQSQISC